MEIRILQQPELLPALRLVWEVYADAIAPKSTPEGVASFQKFIKYDYISQIWKRGDLIFFGAYDGAALCGTLALRQDGHIALFFVAKERQGQGIGRLLFQQAYYHCAQYLHAGRLTVNAAPDAADLYIHMGMRPVSGEQEREGMRYIPMEMYVNLGMVSPKNKQSKAPWIALGVFGVVLVLALSFIGVNAFREFRAELDRQREWNWNGNTPDFNNDNDDNYGNDYDYGFGSEEFPYEYGGDEYEEEAEASGIWAIPEMIDDNISYDIEEDMYEFSDEEKQSMVIEFQVSYPKISGLGDASVQKEVNEILKARAMETVKRIYDDPVPEIRERVIGEEYPMLIDYVDYKVCYASEDVLSVVYEDYGYEGGQNYYAQHLRTCNINLKDGKVYELKDIVKLSDAFMEDWLVRMRGEAEDDAFLSEADQETLKKALEGDSQNGVYDVNFFLDADGIEIGFDLNYAADDENDRGYVWVTAPYTLEEIEAYASDSGLWKKLR